MVHIRNLNKKLKSLIINDSANINRPTFEFPLTLRTKPRWKSIIFFIVLWCGFLFISWMIGSSFLKSGKEFYWPLLLPLSLMLVTPIVVALMMIKGSTITIMPEGVKFIRWNIFGSRSYYVEMKDYTGLCQSSYTMRTDHGSFTCYAAVLCADYHDYKKRNVAFFSSLSTAETRLAVEEMGKLLNKPEVEYHKNGTYTIVREAGSYDDLFIDTLKERKLKNEIRTETDPPKDKVTAHNPDSASEPALNNEKKAHNETSPNYVISNFPAGPVNFERTANGYKLKNNLLVPLVIFLVIGIIGSIGAFSQRNFGGSALSAGVVVLIIYTISVGLNLVFEADEKGFMSYFHLGKKKLSMKRLNFEDIEEVRIRKKVETMHKDGSKAKMKWGATEILSDKGSILVGQYSSAAQQKWINHIIHSHFEWAARNA